MVIAEDLEISCEGAEDVHRHHAEEKIRGGRWKMSSHVLYFSSKNLLEA